MRFFGAVASWVLAGTLMIRSAGWGAPLFGEPHAYPVGTSPVGIAVGEFSGTPGIDLATVEEGNTVTILTNDGKGTFARGGQIAIAGQYVPTGIASGRFNNDLIDDFALSAEDTENLNFNGAAVLYRSTAALHYSATGVTVGLSPSCISFADITGDDVPDLLVCASAEDASGVLSVIPGRADGMFGAVSALSLGAVVPYRLVAVDIDHDAAGRPDLLVVDMVGNAVWIFYGKDPGGLPGPAFEPPVKLASVTSPTAAVVAAFGQDTLLDIAVTSAASGSGQVLIFRQEAPRTFAKPVAYPVGAAPVALAAADLDGTGTPDLLSVNNHSSDVTVLLGNADGSFEPAETVAVGSGPVAIAVGDFNGDARPDFATANQDDETFGLNSQSVSIVLNSLILFDPNCDGKRDAADVATVTHRIFDRTSGCLDRPVTAADITLAVLSMGTGR
jgi:hypothetical protein